MNKIPSGKLGAVHLTTALLALVTIGVFPLGLFLIAPLEARHPPAPALQEIAGIIVLGGGEEADRWGASGEIALNEAGERLLAGIALAHRFPDAPLLFTGDSPGLIGTSPAPDPSPRPFFRRAALPRSGS